jgi:hypothetical protein
MPQPSLQQVHVQAALTQIAVAYLQDESFYVADEVFPVVPVEHQADFYFTYSKDDFFRDEAQERADGTESAGGGFNLTSSSQYQANVWAYHKDVGEQVRNNADPAVDIDVAATKICMQKLLIRRDRVFVTKYLANGIWNTDITGVASGPSATQTIFWNDDGNGDPFTDIATGQTTILQNTGYEANTLLVAFPVYQALRKHPLVIDRIKYTTRADASKITPELLAAAFDVDRVVISKAVYNTSIEGTATAIYSFIAGKDALLCHAAPAPGLMIPSAGYVFAWSGLAASMNNLGVRVAQIPMPWLGLGTVRTEGDMAFDMKAVSLDLGYHFSGIVQ